MGKGPKLHISPPSARPLFRDLVPLSFVGLIAALLFALLSSHVSVKAPYTSDLVRTSATDTAVYTDLAFGSQSFKVLVDTGSADTWLASTDFACFIKQKAHPQTDCKIGPLYHIDGSFTEIPGEILHTSYEPMVVVGIPGTAPITLAGLKATANVGAVNRLSGPGLDPFASGLLGLGFSPETNFYTANSTDAHHTNVPSSSILTSIFEQKKLPHKFSIAVSRGETNGSDGGTFTIGPLPDLRNPRINATNEFANAAFQVDLRAQALYGISPGVPKLAWYEILVDGLYYGTLGNTNVNTTPTQYILDTGASAIVIPEADLIRWLSMFDPPMPYNKATLEVNCNAIVPNLEFRIGGKLFFMNPIDLVAGPYADGRCLSKVQPGTTEYFLGDPFHRNVLAVYDWENEQMQFASRPYYKS